LQVTTNQSDAQAPRRYDVRVSTTLDAISPLDAALERVGDRWSLLLVEALLDGPRKFGELQATMTGVAPNILTDRIRRLERAGVLVGEPYTKRPLRLAYRLSAEGLELAGVLRLLAAWGGTGATRGAEAGEPLRHPVCGTPLEARWYCPTCARVADEHETSGLRYL